MTERQHSDDSDENGSDADPAVADTLAGVHRHLGTTGVRMNEAHAHLSALRSLTRSDSKAKIVESEAEALIQTLKAANEELKEVIDLAVHAPEGVSGEGGNRPEHRDDPNMLWNTVYPDSPLSSDPY